MALLFDIKQTRVKIVASAIALVLSAGLAGCNDDDDDDNNSSEASSLQAETQPFGWGAMYADASGSAQGTTGGEGAAQESIYIVTTRQELKDALNNVRSKTYVAGDSVAETAAKLEPKIIYWQGTIHGDELEGGGYADAEYYKTHPNKTKFDFDLYVKGFDADYMAHLDEVIAAGGDDAAAAQEEKDLIKKQNGQRGQYANNQKSQIQFQVPPNTTLLGVGSDAKLVEGYLSLNTTSQSFNVTENSNIIIRNITFQAPRDFAPAWDAGDGDTGNWNARYDAISINDGANIWIDHCTFTDGEYPDSGEEVIFGHHVQRHDGLLDIEDSADYLTISYNIFTDHDKTTIIGSGDGDEGNYRVTFSGNLWNNVTQRAPRVRWGQVHLYNNLHIGASDADYPILYSIGMGYRSSILSESNGFNFSGAGVDESTIIGFYNGTKFKDVGSWYNGEPATNLNQIALDKCKAGQDEAIAQGVTPDAEEHTDWITETCTNDPGWQPPYSYTVAKSAQELETFVKDNAGAGKLNIAIPDTASE